MAHRLRDRFPIRVSVSTAATAALTITQFYQHLVAHFESYIGLILLLFVCCVVSYFQHDLFVSHSNFRFVPSQTVQILKFEKGKKTKQPNKNARSADLYHLILTQCTSFRLLLLVVLFVFLLLFHLVCCCLFLFC